jgi:anti-sigma factor RsiW
MRRRPGNRSDISADNTKSNQNPHLSEEQLLLVLDGELSARETAQAEAHLQACWSCRARSEQIGEVIAAVVEYRDSLIEPHPRLSDAARAMFAAQLDQLVRSVGRPTLWSRIVGLLRALQTFSQAAVPRHVWISGFVTAAFTLLLLTRLWEVPRVSASRFLANAQASEVRALQGVAKPVVYQKLRIRLGSQGVTRTIYRDPDGKRQVDHLDSSRGREAANNGGSSMQGTNRSNASQVVEAELQQAFRTARLNWEDPLSPTSYSAWHDSLSQKQDEVTQVGDGFLTLKTTTVEGPIAEASITVRTADFHSVAEDLHLQDAEQVEINELAWEVIPMEAINPAIFAVEPDASPTFARSTLPYPDPAGPSDVELAEAELQARVAMHAEEADLGEQIEFDRNTSDLAPYGRRSLIIRGIVSTPERKAALSAAFRGIPHLELKLQTIEEAAALQDRGVLDGSQGPARLQPQTSYFTTARKAEGPGTQEHREGESPKPIPADAVVGKPALEEQLEEHFANTEDRAALVNKAVELAQNALAQAWALRRLRDRYTPEEVARLGHGSRQTLELLIHDHVSALQQHLDATRNLVSPLLPAEQTQTTPPSNSDALPPAAEPVNNWRSAVTEIFLEVQKVHNNIAALFGGAGEPASDGQVGALELRLALVKLETQLPALYQDVSGPFLSEARKER